MPVVPAPVEALATAVQAVVGHVTLVVEAVFDPIALVVEVGGAAFVTMVLGDFGPAVQPLVDAVALAVEADIDARRIFVALYIFMLAAIAGHVIISRVPVILHTPLMSGSNFIHGIVLIGAMVVLGHADTTLEKAIGFIAVLLGAGNAAGGYVVTERMLDMFKSSKKPDGKGEKA
jgi:NAD(P) transhydrogenase subunit alpha